MTRPNLNAVALLGRNFDGAIGSTGFDVLRTNGSVRPEFLFLWTRTTEFVRELCGNLQGVVYPAVRPDDIRRCQIPLPPLAEQHRIADSVDSYLTRLDAAAEGLRRVEANLKRYRASVLKAAVEGRLVPTEAELAKCAGRAYEPASELLARILEERRRRWEAAELAKMKAKGESPKTDAWKSKYRAPTTPDTTNLPALSEGWCWAKVEVVGDVLLGRQRAPQYLTGKHAKPYLRVANVKDDWLDCSDLEEMDFDPSHFEKYQLRPQDILVSEGQSPELVGQSAIYAGGIPNLCFQKTLHRFRPVPGGPSAQFAQLVFRSHVKSGTFMRLASITTNIAHLTLEKFESAPFPLAPVLEQERIVEEASRLLSQADALGQVVKSQLVKLTQLRQSILTWAFEGKLVDQDPNDEPATVLLDRIREQRDAAGSPLKPRKVVARPLARKRS